MYNAARAHLLFSPYPYKSFGSTLRAEPINMKNKNQRKSMVKYHIIITGNNGLPEIGVPPCSVTDVPPEKPEVFRYSSLLPSPGDQ